MENSYQYRHDRKALMVPVVYCDPDCDRKISTNGLAGAVVVMVMAMMTMATMYAKAKLTSCTKIYKNKLLRRRSIRVAKVFTSRFPSTTD